MINNLRVRRIKNLIYAFFVVLFFLPAVLVAALFFRVISLEKDLQSAVTSAPPASQAGTDNFGVAVDNQSGKAGIDALLDQSSMSDSTLNSEESKNALNAEQASLVEPSSNVADSSSAELAASSNVALQPEKSAVGNQNSAVSSAPPLQTSSSSTATDAVAGETSGISAPSQGSGASQGGVSIENPRSGGDSLSDNPGQADHPNTGGPQ